MTTAVNHQASNKVKLTGRLSEFRDALQEEIKEIEKNGQNSTLLLGGHRIEAKGEGFWYRFFVEYMPLMPADTPCKLTVGTDQYDVTVISSNENEIILSSKNKLPANIGKAKLENGSTVLMERLIKCIEDNTEKKNPAGERMFPDEAGKVYQAKSLFSYKDIHYAKHSNEGQKLAVKSALENDITYIWGPPGTGKTTVIGSIIDELYRYGRTVLIVSHTNTAVDGAIIKACDSYKEIHGDSQENYPILRIGIASDAVPERALLESHIERLGEELIEKKTALEARKLEINNALEKIRIILKKHNWQKNSELPEIKRLYTEIDQLLTKKSLLDEQIERTKAKQDEILLSQPGGSSLFSLKEECQEKKGTLKEIKEEITTLDLQENQYASQYQEAEDEVKKHTIHEELQRNINEYMSVQFYVKNIAETDNEIKSREKNIESLEKKKEELKGAIRQYESKGSVAKFFAGKAAYEQNQKVLSETVHSIESVADTISQKRALLADYQKQLNELKVLLDKQKAVKPTKSIKYWTSKVRELENSISGVKTRKALLENKRREISLQLSRIELRLENSQPFFDAVQSLKVKCDEYQAELASIKKNLTNNKKQAAALLQTERELCEEFHQFIANDGWELIDELTALDEQVYLDLRYMDIAKQEQKREACEEEMDHIQAKLNEIQKKMAELEKQAIMNAGIVGTTLAKSYLSDVLRERQFDTVILDEASMASIPALWCAAYLAEKNIVIVGDFLQLPPIVLANTPMAQEWLGKDIFNHSKMQEMAEKKNKDIRPANFVMLNEQYRMEKDIADIANLYYGPYTKLKSDDMNPFRVKNREAFYSWYSGKRTTDG